MSPNRLACALACALSFAPLPTSAQVSSAGSEAKRLFEEGVQLAEAHRWAEALARFEASMTLVERGSTAFNMGIAYTKLNQPTEALNAFTRYRQLEPDEAASREDVLSKFEADARARFARIDLLVRPEDAKVELDGQVVAGSGGHRTLFVDPGARTLEVSAPQFAPHRAVFRLEPAAELSYRAELKPAKAAEPPAVVETPPVHKPVSPDPVVETTKETTEDSGPFDSPVVWIVGGILIVGGAIVLGVALSGEEDPYTGSADTVLRGLRF